MTALNNLNQRYGLNPAHSEVINACDHITAGKVLDMGCSNGRNALYLSQLGFDVTAVDANPNAIATLRSIIQQENLSNLTAKIYDLHHAALEDNYDFIVCTVTLMFLDPSRIPAIIEDMQTHTRAGGYHLIVCAMDTQAHPCPIQFPFLLKEQELSDYYAGWELIKYNEDLGTMHNGAQLQFATLLARKPE